MTKKYLQNTLFDSRIDLTNSFTTSFINDCDSIEYIEAIVTEFFMFLENPIGKLEGKIKRDKELKTILIKYYGLDGRKYTKEEISLLIDKSLERIRQILLQFHEQFREIIKNENQDFKINKLVSGKILEFYDTISSTRILSKSKLNNLILPSLNISANNVKDGYFQLFLDTFEISERTPNAHHLKDNSFLFSDKSIKVDNFFEICYLVYIFLEKNTLPTDLEDIIIDVKRKKAGVKNDLIELACNEIIEIETVKINGKQKYQLKFECLSNARDMIYRVLSQKGEFTKSSEILKEINHTLFKCKVKKKITSTVSSQLPADDRFTSQGKTGYWGLKEWQGSNETLFDLINNTLLHFNKPLSKKDIFDYILKSRPKIPVRSLATILYDKTRYTKLTDGTFILNEWNDLYKSDITKGKKRITYTKENPIKEQIRDQAVQLIRQNGDKELYLNTVVNALHSKFNYVKASIYAIITKNEDFIKTIDAQGKKLVTLNNKHIYKTPSNKNTSVFVSYSWEDKFHQEKVISFVDFLRKKGFNADLDIRIMEEETSIDFNKLMHAGIKNYDKVVIVLSPTYKIKAESFKGGVGKEYRYIQNNIEKEPQKFIFTSFNSIDEKILKQIVPLDFEGREIIDLPKDEANNFQKLFSKLTNTRLYNFSDVASNTPIIEGVKIKPFKLS